MFLNIKGEEKDINVIGKAHLLSNNHLHIQKVVE